MNEIQFLMYDIDEEVVVSILEKTTQHGEMEGKTHINSVKFYNDEFSKNNRYEILEGHGHITHSEAKKKAIGEYKEFNRHQKIVSDFDKEIRKMQGEQK